jgi:HD-GYP domain-containing protein (c-di-GMP phosphodiesterase class II)
MFEKSNETEEHAERMANLSNQLGTAIGLSEYDLITLELTATLHDIGKIGVRKEILEKPSSLSEEEWIEIKKHPDIGYRIAKTIPELSTIAEYILCHHERWDGNGYPRGLSGEEIPLISRIISVIDSYDAMTENRAYKRAFSKDVAVLEIIRNSGTQFDPKIAKTFVHKVLGEDHIKKNA